MNRAFLSISTVFVCLAFFRCSTDSPSSGNTNNPGVNPSYQHALDSLAVACHGACTIDSSASYLLDNHELAVHTVNDSGDSTTLLLRFTSINGSEAIAVVDSSAIPSLFENAQLVFTRMSGSADSIENSLWFLDSIRFGNDSLGIGYTVVAPGKSFIVLNSSDSNATVATDTTGSGAATQALLVTAIATCPMLALDLVSQQQFGSLLLPIDSVDLTRSTCDTTWGFYSATEVYVTTNKIDSLFFFTGTTQTLTQSKDLKLIAGLLMLLMKSSGSTSLF